MYFYCFFSFEYLDPYAVCWVTLITQTFSVSLGYSQTQATILRGARWSTDKAFLSRTVHRENVDILTKAAVTKVRIG